MKMPEQIELGLEMNAEGAGNGFDRPEGSLHHRGTEDTEQAGREGKGESLVASISTEGRGIAGAMGARENLLPSIPTAEKEGGLSDEEKAVIRAKALVVLREEFPARKVEATVLTTEDTESTETEEAKTREGTQRTQRGADGAQTGLSKIGRDVGVSSEPEVIQARMLNEFVYCARLFYYEFVEGVFVESADTARGAALHEKVDSGKGDLPKAAKGNAKGARSGKGGKKAGEALTTESTEATEKAEKKESLVIPQGGPATSEVPEVIHSRSVQMGSARLGVIAKMDLVEVRTEELVDSKVVESSGYRVTEGISKEATEDATEGNEGKEEESAELKVIRLSNYQAADGGRGKATGGKEGGDSDGKKLEPPAVGCYEGGFVQKVCPVDYKVGPPRVAQDGKAESEGPQLWDADRMQLGLQALILRDNGYVCEEGIIYYRATKQRVRLTIDAELEAWVLQKISEARKATRGPMPPPLVNSPKCAGCSLAPVCLPDETRLMASEALAVAEAPRMIAPRRLMAARDDERALYLNTPGLRVGCKEEVLHVKEKDKLVDEFRMRDVDHVALFGNIQISTQAVQALCGQEIPITYFSMGGWFYGITRGHTMKNVFLRMEQFRLAREEKACLAFAKRFVNGKIRNHRTLLMRNHVEPPAPTILKLKRAADDALGAASVEELLGIEGSAANLYFQAFDGMIKAAEEAGAPEIERATTPEEKFHFNFERRNRRPPTDPVNAMLSLAYSLLSKDCMLAVLAVGFDPYIGFYHQPRFGRPALALDLMEEFRPLIAESVVLNCINNRVITTKDFVRAGEAVNLSFGGRKKFFQTYEQRMSSLLTHPLFDYKVSYRRALELQGRLLAKTLTGEILEYVPLLTR